MSYYCWFSTAAWLLLARMKKSHPFRLRQLCSELQMQLRPFNLEDRYIIQLSSKGWLYRMKDAFTSISYFSIAEFSYTANYNFLYWKGLPCLSHSHPFALSPFFPWDVVAQQGLFFPSPAVLGNAWTEEKTECLVASSLVVPVKDTVNNSHSWVLTIESLTV